MVIMVVVVEMVLVVVVILVIVVVYWCGAIFWGVSGCGVVSGGVRLENNGMTVMLTRN